MRLSFEEVKKYITVGLINTAGGLALIYLCMAAGLGDIIANVVGYALGLTLSFFLHGRWTFSRSKLTSRDFVRFLLATALAYATNLALMLFVRDNLGLGRYAGQLAGVVAYAAVGFWGMKFLAFTSNEE